MTSTARGAASGAAGCGSERRGPHFRPGVSALRVGCGPRAGSAALRVPRSGEWAATGRGGRGRGSGRPAGRLGLSRLLPGWRVGALGRRRRPPGVWTTARWTGPPWDSCEVRGRARGTPAFSGRPVRAAVGKLRIPSGRARNLVPAVASRRRSSLCLSLRRVGASLQTPVPGRQPGPSALRRTSPSAPRGPSR